jgi:hypothetical protein
VTSLTLSQQTNKSMKPHHHIRTTLALTAAMGSLILGAAPANAASIALINGNLETPGTNFPVLNANNNPAHGWYHTAETWAVTTTGPSSPQEAGGGAMHGLIHGQASGGAIRQVTPTVMVEGTTYTAMMDIYHRDFTSSGSGTFSLISGTSSGSGGTITILNTTTGITAPVTQGQWLLDVTVQYTATAADAGNFIGIAIDNVSGASNWIEFDNVRLDAAPIPEPASLGLLALGGLGLLTRRRR